MTAKRKGIPRTEPMLAGLSLRQQAEALLRNQSEGSDNFAASPPEDWQSLLHELRVHQIELELQNEELRLAQAESEKARDRYIDLYDFAPVGYLSLRQPGVILAANLTAAQMLGVPRSQLIGSTLGRFVFTEDQDAYYRYLRTLFGPEARGILDVQLIKSDKRRFYARLEASAREGENIVQIVISDITRLKGAEQDLKDMNVSLERRVTERTRELRESEQRYTAIFERSPFAIALTRMPEATIMEVNDAFLSLFEFSREDVIGKTRIELGIVEPASQALLDAELQARGYVSHFEALWSTKSGKKLILSINLDWVNIDGVKFLLTTVVDITARLQAEEALRLENERFLRFVNSNIIGIIIGEPGGKILLANDYYLGLLGVSRQDLLDGRVDWRQFTPPEWLPADENAIREMRERGVCEPYEKEYIRADGTRVPVYVADAMIPGPNEQVASFVLDITQRKQAEKTLRESEERLRLAYEAADLGIWQQDPISGRISADQRARLRYGFDAEEITPADLFERVHPDDLDRLKRELAAMLDPAGSGRYKSEYRVLYPADSEVRWLSVQAQVQFAGEGEGRRPVEIIGITRDITERKRDEQALREARDELELRVQQRTEELALVNSELARTNADLVTQIVERDRATAELRLVSAALEAAANGIIITSRNGDIRWANPAFQKMTGYSHEEVIGQNPRLLKSGLHSGEFYRDMWTTILSGEVWRGETINRRKDGSLYTEEQTITPLKDERGDISDFIAIKQDITERVQAEQALKQSEELLQKVLITLPVGVWITDASGKIIKGNPAGQQIWQGARFVGIDRYGEYKGWWLDSGVRIEAEQWAVARAVTCGETSLNEEIEIECFDGTHKIILNSAVPILDEGNAIQGAIIVNQDITEQKRAAQALAEREALFRTAFEILPVGVWLTDDKGKIVYGNPAGQQIWAGAHYVNIDQFGVYKAWWVKSGLPVGPEDWAIARAINRGETSLDEELEIECFDGTHKFILNSALPIRDDRQQITGVFVVNQDVTERMRAREQLERKNRELLELSESEHQQRQIAETVCTAAQALTQSLVLEDVVSTLLEHVNRIVPCDTAIVAVLEEEGRLKVRAVHGDDRWRNLSVLLVERHPTNSLTQILLLSLEPLRVNELVGCPGWETAPEEDYIHSWLGIPILTGDKALGVVWLGKAEAEFFTPEHAQLAKSVIDQAGVAIQNAWLFGQVQANSERLQYLSRRLVDVQENEMRYVAQELHDEVGHAITSFMFGLERIKKGADKPDMVRAESDKLDQLAESVMENLHRLAMDLRPASLDRLGLEVVLQQQIETLRDKHGLDIRFEMIGVGERLPADMEIALFRIVQEALNNIARHARATRADVLIQRRDESLVLIVEDNGVGFDPELAITKDRLGLVGMRERAEMLGGRLIIESTAGGGTTISVEVPYANSDSHRG